MAADRAHVILHASRLHERGVRRLGQILKDVALAPAPVTPARARAMIDALAAAPLPRGARGRPPLDVEAVVDTVVRVSWLAADLGARLIDLEINPLIVERAAHGAIAVDARGSIADADRRPSA